MIELRFLHSALSLMVVYQCIKFPLISFYTFRDKLQTSFFIAKIKGSNSLNTGDRVMVFAFGDSLHSPLSLNQVSFNFNTFRDMLQTKIRKGNNSQITCNRVTVLALCASSDGRLSMYQVNH